MIRVLVAAERNTRNAVEGFNDAWCPGFASVFWTLTWAEEGTGRPTEYFQPTISGRTSPIRSPPLRSVTKHAANCSDPD